jgi:hypothetical protein
MNKILIFATVFFSLFLTKKMNGQILITDLDSDSTYSINSIDKAISLTLTKGVEFQIKQDSLKKSVNQKSPVKVSKVKKILKSFQETLKQVFKKKKGSKTKKTRSASVSAFLADSLTCSIFGTTATVQFKLYLQQNPTGTDSFWISLVRTPTTPGMIFQTSGNVYTNIVTPVAIGNMAIPTPTPITVYGVRGQCNNLSLTSYLKIRVSQTLVGAGSSFGYVFLNVAWSHGGGSYTVYNNVEPILNVPNSTPPWAAYPWIEGIYNTPGSKITQVQSDLNSGNYATIVSSTPVSTVLYNTPYWGKRYNNNTLLQWRRSPTVITHCICGVPQ